jgi:hypothetical protein
MGKYLCFKKSKADVSGQEKEVINLDEEEAGKTKNEKNPNLDESSRYALAENESSRL